ncbi:MAG TPA: penicillin-binding protein 1A [Gammaproteobacteria bacterium]|nr:penicillin-binding protein 1A [Gammaproteobacteria bacterium]
MWLLRLLMRLFVLGLVGAVFGGLTIGIVAYQVWPTLPKIESFQDLKVKVPLKVFSRDLQLIAEFGEERRIPIRTQDTPQALIDAILAAEDSNFYHHFGIDPKGLLRALLANIRGGKRGQGASTITMQVARNYFLSREKTYTRKFKEIMLSFRLEYLLSKDQILELYLNKIFLGQRAYGFAAAAQTYYGRTLDKLTIPEFAMLAGLPKAPSHNNPLSNPTAARVRRDYVLGRMRELAKIDQTTYEQAISSKLTASRHVLKTQLKAPYVAEMVRQEMFDRFGEEAYNAGYRVITTVRADLQRKAREALRAGLLAYDKRHGFRGAVIKHSDLLPKDTRVLLDRDSMAAKAINKMLLAIPSSGNIEPALVITVQDKLIRVYIRSGKVVELAWPALAWARPYISARRRGKKPHKAAQIVAVGDVIYIKPGSKATYVLSQIPTVSGSLISLNPDNGNIMALVGGFDYYLNKFNHSVQAKRQPGSNIKPFIYLAALEKGFTPVSLVSGAPIVLKDATLGSVWRPENYSGKFFGPVRLREALKRSMNLVSVRLLRSIGIDYAIRFMQRFGFKAQDLPHGLSLALGTLEITPLQLITKYAALANGGYRVQPHVIERIEDGTGRVLEQIRPLRACRDCILPLTTTAAKGVSGSVPAGTLPRAARIVRPEYIYQITEMMREVIRTGTGRRARVLGRHDLAGKTGTTNNYRDAWFSGFNSGVVTSVWVGFDRPADLGNKEAGSRAALPIWINYMKTALAGVPEKPLLMPDNVVPIVVDKKSGRTVPVGSPQSYTDYFIVGTQPQTANGVKTGDSSTGNIPATTKNLF